MEDPPAVGAAAEEAEDGKSRASDSNTLHSQRTGRLLEIPATEISDASVTMTIFDGRTVYRRTE